MTELPFYSFGSRKMYCSHTWNRVETPRPVALSLLMEGEDFGFWQKLKNNAYTDNKILWMPQRISLRVDISFLCFCCPRITKKSLWSKNKTKQNRKKNPKPLPKQQQKISQHKPTSKQTKRSIKQLEIFLETKDIKVKI